MRKLVSLLAEDIKLNRDSWIGLYAAMCAAIGVAVGLFIGIRSANGQQLDDPLGLPMTAQSRALGQCLFFDPRLSQDGWNYYLETGRVENVRERFEKTGRIDRGVSCAFCHDPRTGFTSPEPVALGNRRLPGTINSPSIVDVVFGIPRENPLMFVDGRTRGAPTQALQPLVNPLEMGNRSEQQVLNRLRSIDGYVALFNESYPGVGITRNTYGHAITSFEATIVSNEDTPLHRRIFGDLNALTTACEIGYGLVNKAGCFNCHITTPIYEGGPILFTSREFSNNGSETALKSRGDDTGRFNVNGRQDRVRAFKMPGWIDLAKTAPYFHHGMAADLERVVRHYSRGGARYDGVIDPEIDRRIVAQNWSAQQERYVVNFLREATRSPTSPTSSQPALPR